MTKSSGVGSRSVSRSPAEVRGVDTGAWARVDADALPPEQRKLFMRRRRAIELYVQGASDRHLVRGRHVAVERS